MQRKRLFALVPLAAALVLYVAQYGVRPPELSLPSWFGTSTSSVSIPSEHAVVARPLRELVRSHPQRNQLGSFYLAMAELLPKLPSDVTAAQMRQWLEQAVTLRFSGEFQQLPGLGQAIHGPEGVIAKIYGLDQGKLDVPKMQAALRAVAWACQ